VDEAHSRAVQVNDVVDRPVPATVGAAARKAEAARLIRVRRDAVSAANKSKDAKRSANC
jgi:hypothetical protein